MKTFTSNSEAKRLVEQIANTKQVFFTNEGIEITFTNNDSNQKQIALELSKVFSDVKLKGRKVPTVIVNRLSQVTDNMRVVQVTY